MEMSIQAIRFAEKSFLVSGAFVTSFYLVYVLTYFDIDADTLQILCVNLAVTFLTLLYGCLGVLLLAPVRGRLERMKILRKND